MTDTVTLSGSSLLSKWGFSDGGLAYRIRDAAVDAGVAMSGDPFPEAIHRDAHGPLYGSAHEALIRLVRRHLLPAVEDRLGRPLPVSIISTGHNPIRARVEWEAEHVSEEEWRACEETVVEVPLADAYVAMMDTTIPIRNDPEPTEPTPGMFDLNALRDRCHGDSKAAGWYDNPESDNVPTKLALIHSEVSEALEGYRKGLMDDHLHDRPMIEVELADAVIRIADLCGFLGLDLQGAVVAKLDYNKTRADHKKEARAASGGKKF